MRLEDVSETEGTCVSKGAHVVRPVILVGADPWATTKVQEASLEQYEMRMWRWMCGVTRGDTIIN